MGVELIYESIYSGLALMDSQLQIWTTFTFALIVAVHVGAGRIGRPLVRLALALYGLCAAVLILRNVIATYLAPWPVPWIVGMLIGVGTLVLMAGGSLATLWFVRETQRKTETNA